MIHPAPDSALARLRRSAARVGVVGLLGSTAILLPAPVAAHGIQVERYGSFLGGLFHPVLGPDHLLAMVSVGVVSTMIGGRAILTVPATFVTFMAIGGALGIGIAGLPMTLVELGIAGSVLVLGAMIGIGRRAPTLAVMAGVAFFGSLHGYAHGVEMPRIAAPLLFSAGFLTGTATLHLIGVLIGEVARQYGRGLHALRVAGSVVALLGVLFLLGII